AVLELARRFSLLQPAKTVKFIAFSTEELELLFEDADMGSYRYAKEARSRGDKIEAVICIDMIGYFTDLPGSQHCPLILRPFYPDRGNFIGFGSDIASYPLMEKVVGDFKKCSDLQVESLCVPVSIVPELMTSDNRSFWSFGYPSVWVTDTCIFRNFNMHTKKDSFDTLDYPRMSKVVDGIYCALVGLAGG
nr:M28 family peptidase [Candidatus Omnitrophota bacterium]